jgi:guanylate kinase
MAHYPEFDYLLVNDQFDETLASLIYIVRAERLRCDYQKQKMSKLLTELLQSQ